MIQLTKLIQKRGLTQSKAARLMGVTQPRISDLARGKIYRFSIDTLVEMLGHAGVRVSLLLKIRKRGGLIRSIGLARARSGREAQDL